MIGAIILIAGAALVLCFFIGATRCNDFDIPAGNERGLPPGKLREVEETVEADGPRQEVRP